MITPLNFNADAISQSFNDRKNGVEIVLGHVSGLWPILEARLAAFTPISLALMDRGFGQKELDGACAQMSEACAAAEISILITKCDLPFDARWFMIGDLPRLLEAAKRDRIAMPFSEFMCDELVDVLGRYPNRNLEEE